MNALSHYQRLADDAVGEAGQLSGSEPTRTGAGQPVRVDGRGVVCSHCDATVRLTDVYNAGPRWVHTWSGLPECEL